MQLWTYEHFISIVPTVIIMIIVTIILNKFLKNKPYETRAIPFKIIAALILLSEIIKQVLSLIKGYDLYHIPLHVCSLFAVFIPLMAFYRGKAKNVIRTLTCTVCISLWFFMIAYPNLIYSPDNVKNFFNGYFDFHTVFFHNAVLCAFILIIGLNLHELNDEKHDKYVLIVFSGYALTAATMAQLLKTNYANFYTCNVGPVYDFVLNIKGAIGDFAGQALYVTIMLILNVAFFYGAYQLYRLVDKVILKIKTHNKKVTKSH